MSSASCTFDNCNRCYPKGNDSLCFAEWDDTDCVVMWVGCQKIKLTAFEAQVLGAQLQAAAEEEERFLDKDRCPMGYTTCGVCGTGRGDE